MSSEKELGAVAPKHEADAAPEASEAQPAEAQAETPAKTPPPQDSPSEASAEPSNKGRKKLRFWRFIAFVLAMAMAGVVYLGVAGRIQLRPVVEPAADQNPFKLRDEQLRVADGTIALVPPEDSRVDIGENFVNSAILEAKRWYGAYLAGTEVPAHEPVIFGLSTLHSDLFPTLCLAQDVSAEFPYAFYCKDEHTVWVPHTALLVGTRRPVELGLEPNADRLDYSPRFASAAVGVFAYSSALVDHLATRSGKHMVPLHRMNDGLVAACFTGAWANTGRKLPALATSAAVGAIKKYGEPRLLRHARPDLESAYRLGQETRNPLACLSAYWPWMATPSGLPTASPRSPQPARPSTVPSATPSATRQ